MGEKSPSLGLDSESQPNGCHPFLRREHHKPNITDQELEALLHAVQEPAIEPDPKRKEQIIRDAVEQFEREGAIRRKSRSDGNS